MHAIVVARAVGEKYTAAGPGGTWADGTYYTVSVSSIQNGSAPKIAQVFSENFSSRFSMTLNKPYLMFIGTCDGVQYVDAKGNSGPLHERLDVLREVMNLALPQKGFRLMQ